jgi:hypothetical protein
MLHGVFHPRVKYEEEVKEELASSSRATLPLPEPVPASPAAQTEEE